MLKDYGSTAGNPTGHLKAYITGNHCHFPIIDGEMVRGGAQDIYFCEFDGPAKRTVLVLSLIHISRCSEGSAPIQPGRKGLAASVAAPMTRPSARAIHTA